jgi:hypothetical protein
VRLLLIPAPETREEFSRTSNEPECIADELG